MSLLIDTDDEMNRYDEAALYSRTVKPDMAPGIRSSFNVGTGQTDLLAPLPSGGFVKLGSQAPEITVEAPDIMVEAPAMPGMGADAALPVEDDEFQLQSIRNFAASGANISSRDDYLAAGYSDQLINASGVMGETQQKTGSIEPLSTTEIEGILSEGKSVFQNYDPTMRENGATALTETLIELRVDERREELMAQGVDTAEISRIIASEQPEMRSLSENLADAVFGNKNVLGTGVGDFVTAGVMDMQEGWRMYTDALRNDSPANRALGVLLMAAGVAEATGVGMVLGKTIKKSIPMMQSALVSAGQNAELRMAERGTGTTLNMGGDPMALTDPLVAAAGRAVDDGFVAKVEPPTDDTPGIIAFHGSAADFDGFKLEKIGTGEGAQAYGYGLYFSDKEAIAEWYRNTLSSMGVDPQPLKDAGMTVTEEMMAASYIRTSNSAEDAARDWANWHGKPFNDDLIDTFKAAQVSDGKMYKVGIAVKPEDLLDYDKPLSEQPEKFKTALNEIAKIQGIPVVDQFGQSASFGSFQDALSEKVGPENATREFFEAGIPGIKYLDNTSRDGAGTSSNYVIFDDSMIKILEKYGIVGPVAISAMALSEDES